MNGEVFVAIADNLRRAGWEVEWDTGRSPQTGRALFRAVAQRADAAPVVVQSRNLDAAFLELELQCGEAAQMRAVQQLAPVAEIVELSEPPAPAPRPSRFSALRRACGGLFPKLAAQ